MNSSDTNSTLRHQHGLVAASALALFVLLLYYPLLFTNRVLASGDLLLYFYPYRDYAAAALRTGQIPLWNPYIFLGVPFLANPQAAVLYPLHWPLIWLPVTQQIYWSAAIHTWLLGMGGYCLLRRWGISATGGLITGLVLAGSGFYGGLLGHINQMNTFAWLPWAIWLLENHVLTQRRKDAKTQRFFSAPLHLGALALKISLLSWIVRFALLVALMLLAGHTQSAFINLLGIGLWAVWPRAGLTRQWRRFSAWWTHAGPRLMVYAVGCVLGGLLSAAQLLPTLELSRLGLRSSGLSYGEATSFSLKPLHLLWTLLPTYGWLDLEQAFATPGYTEYVAYLGLIGLLLAVLGAGQGRGQPRTFGLLFAALGLFLALGRWNPFYYLLYRVVPGFDLFRNPARWMMLYTLGMAVLAGVGVDYGLNKLQKALTPSRQAAKTQRFFSAALHLCALALKFPFWLIVLVALDLLLAARALPHTQPTAPQAVYDVRTASAHLLTDPARDQVVPAAAGRFLGMSTITYDPGDMADWRRILVEQPPAQLDERAFAQFVIALKLQELLVPNLSLLWRIPAVDGFDGGVLPLQRYNSLLTLLIPPDQLVPDGRLREQLQQVPSSALLNLLNVQYLITDKVRDFWFEDVFYDRQIGARLRPNGLSQVQIEAPLPFPATQLDLIGYIDAPAETLAILATQTLPVAEVIIWSADAEPAQFTITAGGQPGAMLADPRLDSPLAASGGDTVAYRDVEGQRQEYRVRLTLPARSAETSASSVESLTSKPHTPQTVTIQRLDTPYDLVVQAVTLVDQRTGMFTPLLPSDRGRFRLVHSGDVKVYENLDVRPRAYLAHSVTGVAQPEQALAFLRAQHTISATIPVTDAPVVVEGLPSFTAQPTAGDQAEIVAYAPERIELRTHSTQPALLVLSDSFYPGWHATVDGASAPIYPTNYLFRGLPVPGGDHTVIFHYQPTSWLVGLGLTMTFVVVCLIFLSVEWVQKIRQTPD